MNHLRRELHWIRKNLSTLILVVAVFLQVFLLFKNFIVDLSLSVWQEKAKNASYRSASILFDHHYAEYIEFVKSNVPEDALIIIPKQDQVWNFGNIGLMQYFLYPRKIADCPIETLEECILNLKGLNTFILAPNSMFPPRDLADQVKQFVSFDEESGVYVPLP